MMIRKRFKNRISHILVAATIVSSLFGLGGCGNAAVAVPELKDPLSDTVSIRTADERIVGNISTLMGTVVPKSYPVYSRKNASVKEILVGVGDRVEEGDTIAVITLGNGTEEGNRIRADLASLDREKIRNNAVTEAEIERLEYEQKVEEAAGDEGAAAEKANAIRIAEENLRYENTLNDSQRSSANTGLKNLNDSSGTVKLTAAHSGYVTFVKDVTRENILGQYENVAVISDYDDLYIETDEVNLKDYKYKDYKSKWTTIGGREVELKEYEYTNEETAFSLSVEKNPPMAFSVKGADLTPGVDLVLYFMEEEKIPCLAVGNDSIIREGSDAFVYIENENGNVKTKVETGRSDGLYTEILSGISKGDKVIYTNRAVTPKNYSIFEAKKATYTEACETDMLSIANPYYDIYTTDCDGVYQKVRAEGDVEKGDELFRVESSVKSSDVEAARLAIANLDNARNKEVKDYDARKAELQEIINRGDRYNPETMASDTDAIHEYMYSTEIAAASLKMLEAEEAFNVAEYSAGRKLLVDEYNRLKKGTGKADGLSNYIVTAKEGGTVSYLKYKNEERVEKNGFVMTVEKPGSDEENTRILAFVTGKAGLSVSPIMSAKPGNEVVITKDGRKWKGRCIGKNGEEGKYMLFTRDGKPCTTFSKPFSRNIEKQFYIEIDGKMNGEDIEGARLSFNGMEIRDVISVPNSVIRTETDQLTGTEKNYVWKMVEGDVVKEYVKIYKTRANVEETLVLCGIEAGDRLLK